MLGSRVRQLIDTYATQGIRFFAPDAVFNDAEKYLPLLLNKRGKPLTDLAASLQYVRNIIEPVTPEFYGVFESDARERLRGRDENDWPVLATALARHAQCGPKMKISSVRVSLFGPQIGSRFF